MVKRTPAHLENIRALPLFSSCSGRELALVDALSTELTVAPSTVLQRAGAEVEQFCVIVEGRARASVGDHVDELTAGSCIGAAGLLHRGRATASVTTSTPTVVRVFGRQEFRALIEAVAPVAAFVGRDLDVRAVPTVPAEPVASVLMTAPSGATI